MRNRTEYRCIKKAEDDALSLTFHRILSQAKKRARVLLFSNKHCVVPANDPCSRTISLLTLRKRITDAKLARIRQLSLFFSSIIVLEVSCLPALLHHQLSFFL